MQDIKDEIIEEIEKDKEIDLENISEEKLREIIKSKVKDKKFADSSEKVNYIVKDIFRDFNSQNEKSERLGKSIKFIAIIYSIVMAIISSSLNFNSMGQGFTPTNLNELMYFIFYTLFTIFPLFIILFQTLFLKKIDFNHKKLEIYFYILIFLPSLFVFSTTESLTPVYLAVIISLFVKGFSKK